MNKKYGRYTSKPSVTTKRLEEADTKVHYVKKYHRGKYRAIKGTLEQLTKYFKYTLEVGNSYDEKISTEPKTFRSLMSNLDKSFRIKCGGYDPDWVDAITAEEYGDMDEDRREDLNESVTPSKKYSKKLLTEGEIKPLTKDQMWEMLEDGDIDAVDVAKSFIKWLSESEFKRFCEINEYEYWEDFGE